MTRSPSAAGLPAASGCATPSSPIGSSMRETNSHAASKQADAQNALTEQEIEFREAVSRARRVDAAKCTSLRQRRSNIPRRISGAARESLCRALGFAKTIFLFAGELIAGARRGARLGRRDRAPAAQFRSVAAGAGRASTREVAEWVDRTHLGDRLVYFRVRGAPVRRARAFIRLSLVRKLALKPDSGFLRLARGGAWQRASTTSVARRMDSFGAKQRALYAGRADQGAWRTPRKGRSPSARRPHALRARLVQRGEDRAPSKQDRATLKTRACRNRRPRYRNCDQEAQRGCRNAIRVCSQLAVFESFR